MALKYADFCTRCGKTRTKHPSRICSTCRREIEREESEQRRANRKMCRQCGRRYASGADGLCALCRQSNERSHIDLEEKIQKAIKKTQDRLFILERRAEGNSFATISQMIGIAVSQVYREYAKAMGLSEKLPFTDYVDGAVMPASDDVNPEQEDDSED